MKLLTIVLSIMLGTISHAESPPPLDTVPYVDLNKYLGKWYEIGAIPQFFQRKCIKNTSAEYSLMENGLIKVFNSCTNIDGEIVDATGAAKVVDTQSNSKLRVTFVKIFDWVFSFGGDYWIIDLDEAYSYALIGHPNRDYAWILSRSPSLSPETLDHINTKFKESGYDTCKIITSLQDGGNDKKQRLCDLFTN